MPQRRLDRQSPRGQPGSDQSELGDACAIQANGFDSPAGLVVDAQGRAYTVGLSSEQNNTVWRATLARLTAHGGLDTSFGGDGFQAYQLDLGAVGFRDDTILAVAARTDGMLMLGGSAENALDDVRGAVLRVSATSASFDSGFGNAGRLVLGGNGPVSDLIAQADGMTCAATPCSPTTSNNPRARGRRSGNRYASIPGRPRKGASATRYRPDAVVQRSDGIVSYSNCATVSTIAAARARR